MQRLTSKRVIEDGGILIAVSSLAGASLESGEEATLADKAARPPGRVPRPAHAQAAVA